jgi:DNA-binding beta-propeller fold protein YncE
LPCLDSFDVAQLFRVPGEFKECERLVTENKQTYVSGGDFMISFVLGVALAASGYTAPAPISLPEPGGWDYMTFDEASRQLFVTRGDHVAVVDVDAGKAIGHIDGLKGAHGVALVRAKKRGFITDGKSNSVLVFDTATFKTLSVIPLTGRKPDAIVFDPASGHVLAFNGNSHDASVIDPVTAKQIGSIDLPGAPEFAVSDGAGHVFVNLEDRNALARIDTRSGKVDGTYALTGCDAPSGLAIDIAKHRLFSVCGNEIMAITDGTTGKQVATVPIGKGPDAAGFDPRTGRIFSSNGESGTLTVIEGDGADHYRVTATVPTLRSARTLAVDARDGSVFLAAATLSSAPEGKRPAAVEGSFRILTVSAGQIAGK